MIECSSDLITMHDWLEGWAVWRSHCSVRLIDVANHSLVMDLPRHSTVESRIKQVYGVSGNLQKHEAAGFTAYYLPKTAKVKFALKLWVSEIQLEMCPNSSFVKEKRHLNSLQHYSDWFSVMFINFKYTSTLNSQ